MTIIDATIAKKFISKPDDVSLQDFERITDEAAEIISQADEDIDLAITEISEQSAQSLAKCCHSLYLNWLETITSEVARALGDHSGEELGLDGLKHISDEAAEGLFSHKGEKLSLIRLTELSESSAKALANYEGNEIMLMSLETISDEAAEAMSHYHGNLTLGLKELSDRSASFLANHFGRLRIYNVDGLKISDEALSLLAEHKRPRTEYDSDIVDSDGSEPEEFCSIDLSINRISDSAASAFSDRCGELLLQWLVELSDAAAKYLSKRRGRIDIRLKKISDLAINRLCTSSAKIYHNFHDLTQTKKLLLLSDHTADLDEIEEISDSDAELISRYQGGEIYLDGLTDLSTSAAAALNDFTGIITLNGLSKLSDDLAETLSQSKSDELHLDGISSLSDQAFNCFSTYEGLLSLNGIHALTEGMIKSVENYKCSISLDGLSEIPLNAAQALAANAGEKLLLDGLEKISTDVAQCLSKQKGSLSLDGLVSISDEVAQALSRHKGKLWLEGLETISDEAIESLTCHEGLINGMDPSEWAEEFREIMQSE